MKNELSLWNRVFLFSAVMGTAAAYSMLYLFHLLFAVRALATGQAVAERGSLAVPRALRLDAGFFLLFFLWYVASIVWAENKLYALQYCGYIVCLVGAVFYTAHIAGERNRFGAVYSFLGALIVIEIALSVLEGLGILRLPFSPFSPYRSYFGRDMSDLSVFSASAVSYILRYPTGFFHNPNNLASFLALISPFALFHPRRIVKVVGFLSIFYVIYMCGARAALLAYGIVIFLGAFLWGGNALRIGAVASVVVVMTLGSGLFSSMSQSSVQRVAEVGTLGVAVNDFRTGVLDHRQLSQGSAGVRAQLVLNGLGALGDSYGLGVGAGGNTTVQEQSLTQAADQTSMHNFWVELLVEGGVPFAILFACWYISFLRRLWKVAQTSADPLLRYFGKALFVGFIGFIVGAVGPSSVIYMLPMWMMVGIGLAVIRLESVRRGPGVDGQASLSLARPPLTPLLRVPPFAGGRE